MCASISPRSITRSLSCCWESVVKCRPTAIHYFPGDDLFSPFERRRGLPLGNQTSQFLANVYLNPLDQYVNRELRPACYIRYVDDFLLFGESKAKLAEMRCAVEDFLEALRLLVHERKSRVYRCADGVTFLGGGCFRKNRGWCGKTWSD